MKTWNILFKKSLKSFFKPAPLIASLVLIALMVLLIMLVIPFVTAWKAGSWDALLYTLSFSTGFEITMYVALLCVISNLTFDINEATFFLTRPVKRSTFVSTKLTAQFLIFTIFAFIIFATWLLTNKIYFPNMQNDPQAEYICQSLWTGNALHPSDWTFTMAACIVPYLVANVAVIFINATFKWFNKNWVIPTALTFITLLAIIPYVFYGMFQHQGYAVFKTYCYNSTLVIPSIMFAIIALSGITANVFATKYRKVKV